jgi:hypothetical protein
MIRPLHDKDGFFKYYTADSAKRTLRTATRKWSTPSLFNDPFDNQFELHFENPTDELAATNLDLFHRVLRSPEPFEPNRFGPATPQMELLRQIHSQNPELEYTEEDMTDLMGDQREGMQRVLKLTPEMNAEISRIMADRTIFCVSETHDNLLMWSHYARNHTGAVVKFLSLPEVDSPIIVAQPVRYSTNMPRLSFASLLGRDRLERIVLETITLSKSTVWSYEKEWRIVAALRDKSARYELLPYAPEEVGAVYLGCNMAEEDRNEIIDIVHRHFENAKMFRAEKHERQYELRFIEIS